MENISVLGIDENALNNILKVGYTVVDYPLDGISEVCQAMGGLGEEALVSFFSDHEIKDEVVKGLSPLHRFHYCDENKLESFTTFTNIDTRLIAVGTFLVVFNSRGEKLALGEFDSNCIELGVNQFAVFNLGLSGIGFSIDCTGLLQYVIHSSISGGDCLAGDEDSCCRLHQDPLYTKVVHDKELFLNSIDMSKWVRDGAATTWLQSDIADDLLASLKKEEFQSVNSSGGGDKDYGSRFIAKQSLFKPRELRDEHRVIVGKLRSLFSEVLSNKPNPCGDNVSLFEAPVGHYMEAHSDCGDASPIIIIIYVRDDKWKQSSGGCVVSRKALFDKDLNRVNDPDCGAIKVSPKHGRVVVLNNTSARFTHEVEEVLGGVRCSFIFNLSMLTNPDWNHDYEGKEFGELEMNSLLG